MSGTIGINVLDKIRRRDPTGRWAEPRRPCRRSVRDGNSAARCQQVGFPYLVYGVLSQKERMRSSSSEKRSSMLRGSSGIRLSVT